MLTRLLPKPTQGAAIGIHGLSGRVNVLRSAFTVAGPAAAPAIEGLGVVRQVVAASGAKSDGAFSLSGKSIVPAVDHVLQGGKGAAASFFFRVYPVAPIPSLAFELVRDGQSPVRRPLAAQPGDTAQVVTLDISSMPSGEYDLRILAAQGTTETSATTHITIENGAAPESGTPVYVNQETAIVLRLTLEFDQLPADFPVRQMAVSLDYGDTEVGGQVYTLPLALTVDVRLRKRTQIRNESLFRSYQRFTTNSRIVQ